jgi:hypothetical protein
MSNPRFEGELATVARLLAFARDTNGKRSAKGNCAKRRSRVHPLAYDKDLRSITELEERQPTATTCTRDVARCIETYYDYELSAVTTAPRGVVSLSCTARTRPASTPPAP